MCSLHRGALIPLVLLNLACGTGVEDEPTAPPVAAQPAGDWRAVLASPGGELPFRLQITDDGTGGLEAVAITGAEAVPFSGVEIDADQVVLRFEWYDSEIEASMAADGTMLRGRWRRTSPGGIDTVMGFVAVKDDPTRFRHPVAAGLPGGHLQAVPAVDGDWAVTFTDEDGSEPARGVFRQQGNQVEGTFLTPTGDHRFLEGSYEEGVLRLSTFDGAHAFLFHASAMADGSLEGDFWSRDSHLASWTARRLADGETVLPDAWDLARLTNDEGRFRFAFEDLDGKPVDQNDPRFAGKVLLVNIFGSWCPNCNDEAPLLAAWHERYRDRGLEVVGLAYEFTGDTERDRLQVRRFAERHGITYPILLAGTSDKADAAATLPDLDRVVSYPTTLFIGRDATVRRIHSGFAGPGTGPYYEALVAELEGMIEHLVDE